jgi:hypothetical protein
MAALGFLSLARNFYTKKRPGAQYPLGVAATGEMDRKDIHPIECDAVRLALL